MYNRFFRYCLVFIVAITGVVKLYAQQPAVVSRIAGLEDNEEYMSLLQQDLQLQIREDSIVNAVEAARRHLREDTANRQQNSQQILALENKIFEVRNAKGRLAGRINAIEEAWILANFNDFAFAAQPAPPAVLQPSIPDSLKVRNLIYNPYFKEELPADDYASLRKAQEMEMVAVDYVNRFFAIYGAIAECAEAYPGATSEGKAREIYENYKSLQGANHIVSDSLSAVWEYIFDNKSYAYSYLMEKSGRDKVRTEGERGLTEAARKVAVERGETASDAVADYFIRKKALVGYEIAVAEILNFTTARDSLRDVAAQLERVDFRLPHIDIEERYFIDYDSLIFTATPRYTNQHPIPEVIIHERGTIYRILLGTYTSKRAAATFKGIYPLSYRINEDKKWEYFAGGFATREDAERAWQYLPSHGFTNPEIVVWVDGQYRNLTRGSGETQPVAFRVEIFTPEPLSDEVKNAISAVSPHSEVSRVGSEMFVVGVFSDKAAADRLAAAIRETETELEVKVISD